MDVSGLCKAFGDVNSIFLNTIENDSSEEDIKIDECDICVDLSFLEI